MSETEATGDRSVSGRSRGPLILAVAAMTAFAVAWACWRPGGAEPEGAGSRVVESIETPYLNARPGVAYVGDDACARCHAEIAEAYRTHPMGRSMARGSEAPPGAEGPVFNAGEFTYTIERRGGAVFHRETRKGADGREVATIEAAVAFVLGSGTRGAAYLVEKDGGLFQSPIARYEQAGRWDLAPGYRTRNQHFDRPVGGACLYCHADRVEEHDGRARVVGPPAIGCERCHGPGSLHASSPGAIGAEDFTIVNPADLEPRLRDSVCEQCHLQGSGRSDRPGRKAADYRPGLPFDAFVSVASGVGDPIARRQAVGHFEQLRESLCAKGSDGRLGCISCHDPHRLPSPEASVAYYRDKCLQCHAEKGCSLPAARRPQNDCAGCHMPRQPTSDIDHTAQTSHRITRRGEVGP